MGDKTELQELKKAISNIKEYAEQDSADIQLSSIKERDFKIGLIKKNHTVTGSELNQVTAEIQDYLMLYQRRYEKSVDLYKEIYNAFEALDKGHIDKINATVAGLGVANRKVEDLLKLQENEITNLKLLKERINQVEHLDDIDSLWDFKEQVEHDLKHSEEQIEEIINGIEKIDSLEKKQNELQQQQQKVDDEQNRRLSESEQISKEHEDRLAASKKKDDEQDDILKERIEKDIEHDNELKIRAERDEEHDRLINDLKIKIVELEMQINQTHKWNIVVICVASAALIVSIISLFYILL